MLGNYRPASETPFKWRFAGGPMMARLWWYFDPPSPNLLKKSQSQSWTSSCINFLDPRMVVLHIKWVFFY